MKLRKLKEDKKQIRYILVANGKVLQEAVYDKEETLYCFGSDKYTSLSALREAMIRYQKRGKPKRDLSPVGYQSFFGGDILGSMFVRKESEPDPFDDDTIDTDDEE